MIPVGYMAKKIATKPNWLKTKLVDDIYSVSGCTSHDFADYIDLWKHNGYWFFDSLDIIREVAKEYDISLKDTKFFYYEVYEFQCYEDDPEWETFESEKFFVTNVEPPIEKVLEGYDVVSFSCGNAPECSYLSCNHMAEQLSVNKHCLLSSFEEAKRALDQKAFDGCEPGPCRVFAVYSIKNS